MKGDFEAEKLGIDQILINWFYFLIEYPWHIQIKLMLQKNLLRIRKVSSKSSFENFILQFKIILS
jgi:hypothetical protein